MFLLYELKIQPPIDIMRLYSVSDMWLDKELSELLELVPLKVMKNGAEAFTKGVTPLGIAGICGEGIR